MPSGGLFQKKPTVSRRYILPLTNSQSLVDRSRKHQFDTLPTSTNLGVVRVGVGYVSTLYIGLGLTFMASPIYIEKMDKDTLLQCVKACAVLVLFNIDLGLGATSGTVNNGNAFEGIDILGSLGRMVDGVAGTCHFTCDNGK